MFGTILPVLPHIKSAGAGLGCEFAEAFAACRRAAVAESLPGFEAVSSSALAAPAGCRNPCLDQAHREIRASYRPDIERQLRSRAPTRWEYPGPSSPRFFNREMAKWAKIIKSAGIETA